MKRIRIIVAEVKGELVCLYVGQDAVKANAVMDSAIADAGNDAVALYVYPTPIKTRYPSKELKAPEPAAPVAPPAEPQISPRKRKLKDL